jgi:hypothetical protein
MDQTIRTVVGGDTSTTTVRLTAAGSDLRMEIDNRSGAGPFAKLPLGDSGVMIMRDSGRVMIILNGAKKEYVTIKPLEMMESARKMMESMGGSMTFDSSAAEVKLDSLGAGPIVDAHPTLRYHQTVRFKMTVSMMGNTRTIDNQASSNLLTATDLGDIPGLAKVNNIFRYFGQSMGIGKAFSTRLESESRRLKGFVIHDEKQTAQITGGVTRMTTQIIDARNIRRVSVPDSVFAIPADYKASGTPYGPPPP